MRSSSTSRLPFVALALATLAAAPACGEDVSLYEFPRQVCGDKAIQGAPRPSTTVVPAITLAASDGERIFWVEDRSSLRADERAGASAIHAGSRAGGDDVVLATDSLPTQLAVDDEQIYWGGVASGDGTAIKALDKRGGAPRVVAAVERTADDRAGRMICGDFICPYRFAVDATDIYYGANNSLRRVDKRQLDAVPVQLASGRVASIAVDGTHVFWVECSDDSTTATLRKLAKSGGAPSALAVVAAGSSCMYMGERLVLDESSAYWSAATSLYAVPKGGGATITLRDAAADVSSIAVTASHLYWVTSGARAGERSTGIGRHGLVRSSKAGGELFDIVPPREDHLGYNDDACDALDVLVDDTSVFWVVKSGILTRALPGGGI